MLGCLIQSNGESKQKTKTKKKQKTSEIQNSQIMKKKTLYVNKKNKKSSFLSRWVILGGIRGILAFITTV